MKIWIVWAFNTGKTTLAKEIHSYLLDYKLSTDSERQLAELLSFDFNKHNKKDLNNYQRWLLHSSLNEAKNEKNIITDTAIHTLIWYTEDQKTISIIKNVMVDLYDIIFYLPPELPINDDGVRHTNKDYQHKVDNKIKEAITLSVKENPNLVARTINWNRDDRIVDSIYFIEKYKEWKRGVWF